MAFTRDWNESTVADTAQASTLGAVDRANQVDLSDRLKALIYGFVAGENDGVPGCKNLPFKQQSGDPTVGVDTIALYAKNVGGNNELFTKDEAANVVQLTSAGTVGFGGVTLGAGKDLIGSATSDITINTNKFNVAGATGNTNVGGTLDVVGNIDPTTYETTNGGFLDENDMVSDAADKVASQQSIKAHVAAEIALDASDFTGTDGYAHMSDGFVIQWGEIAGSNNEQAVTFSLEFPTACLQVICSSGKDASGGGNTAPTAHTFTTTGCEIWVPSGSTPVRWIAIGN